MPPPSSAAPPMSSQDSRPPKTKAFKKVPLESYHQMLQCVHNMYRGPSVRFSDKFLRRLMFFANTPAETQKFFDIDPIFHKYEIKPTCKFTPQLAIEFKMNQPEGAGTYRTDSLSANDKFTPIHPSEGPSNMVITEKLAFKNCKPTIFDLVFKQRNIGFSGHTISMDSCKIHVENFEFLALDRHLERLDLTGVHLSDVMEYEFEEVWKRIQNVKHVKY
uniref:SWIB domain-containing protein n=1 Tax=Panagrellus redivivus TaxID=6233 RepID=A0A7E4ZS35_PANRE